MSGLDIMLKQLVGLSPEEIKQRFAEATQKLGQALQHFDARLSALEKRQQETNELLSRIATKIGVENDGHNDAGNGAAANAGSGAGNAGSDATGHSADAAGQPAEILGNDGSAVE